MKFSEIQRQEIEREREVSEDRKPCGREIAGVSQVCTEGRDPRVTRWSLHACRPAPISAPLAPGGLALCSRLRWGWQGRGGGSASSAGPSSLPFGSPRSSSGRSQREGMHRWGGGREIRRGLGVTRSLSVRRPLGECPLRSRTVGRDPGAGGAPAVCILRKPCRASAGPRSAWPAPSPRTVWPS